MLEPITRPGIYLVHKPVGRTSHALVRDVLEDVRESGLRLCHGGTLDPFAEGLLLLLVGHATRLQSLLHHLPKTYEAEIVWGRETDTGDAGGRIILESDPSALSDERLTDALAPFLGWTPQVPPATSAKKIHGEPAYRRAHRGEEVVLPPSQVYLHSARWLSHELPKKSTIEITCRGGYYVRSLARDLGRALGCGAHLSALKRHTTGPWSDPESTKARIGIQGASLVPWCPRWVLTPAEYRALRDRKALRPTKLEPPPWTPPEGFPTLPLYVAATLEDRLVLLLKPELDGHWSSEALFLGGM